MMLSCCMAARGGCREQRKPQRVALLWGWMGCAHCKHGQGHSPLHFAQAFPLLFQDLCSASCKPWWPRVAQVHLAALRAGEVAPSAGSQVGGHVAVPRAGAGAAAACKVLAMPLSQRGAGGGGPAAGRPIPSELRAMATCGGKRLNRPCDGPGPVLSVPAAAGAGASAARLPVPGACPAPSVWQQLGSCSWDPVVL